MPAAAGEPRVQRGVQARRRDRVDRRAARTRRAPTSSPRCRGDRQQQVRAVDAARAVAGGLLARADQRGAGLGRERLPARRRGRGRGSGGGPPGARCRAAAPPRRTTRPPAGRARRARARARRARARSSVSVASDRVGSGAVSARSSSATIRWALGAMLDNAQRRRVGYYLLRVRDRDRRPDFSFAARARCARARARGDAAAFAAVYERHHQALYRYCRSILRHEEDAQDALQSTMARAFAALQDERRDFELRPWLFRIAHNEAISILRRRRETSTELDDVPDARATSRTGSREREELRLLQLDLADLPERQRAALVLRELNGLSHAEIGVVLELSPAAVKQAIFEARSALFSCREGREMACHDVRRMLSDGDGRVAARARRARAPALLPGLPALPRRPRAAPAGAARARAAAAGRRRGRAARPAARRRRTAAKLLACVAIAGGGTTLAVEMRDARQPAPAAAEAAATPRPRRDERDATPTRPSPAGRVAATTPSRAARREAADARSRKADAAGEAEGEPSREAEGRRQRRSRRSARDAVDGRAGRVEGAARRPRRSSSQGERQGPSRSSRSRKVKRSRRAKRPPETVERRRSKQAPRPEQPRRPRPQHGREGRSQAGKRRRPTRPAAAGLRSVRRFADACANGERSVGDGRGTAADRRRLARLVLVAGRRLHARHPARAHPARRGAEGHAGPWEPGPPPQGSKRRMGVRELRIENATPGALYEVRSPRPAARCCWRTLPAHAPGRGREPADRLVLLDQRRPRRLLRERGQGARPARAADLQGPDGRPALRRRLGAAAANAPAGPRGQVRALLGRRRLPRAARRLPDARQLRRPRVLERLPAAADPGPALVGPLPARRPATRSPSSTTPTRARSTRAASAGTTIDVAAGLVLRRRHALAPHARRRPARAADARASSGTTSRRGRRTSRARACSSCRSRC